MLHISTFEHMVKIATQTAVIVEQFHIDSEYLEREVIIDVYHNGSRPTDQTSLLLLNDGQDLVKMPFDAILDELWANAALDDLFCIGIHCGKDRIQEYGTAYAADYLQRGAKAGLYSKFIFEELLPFIRKQYQVPSFKQKSFAGFSLGGLSALDIVWNHPSEFTNLGLFSGALWWRRKAYEKGYDEEKDRLMHLQIRKGGFFPWIKFFFQCGKLDETADRNENGIIDSIDDTLDLIIELKAKGYGSQHIEYVELPEGKHDVATWKQVLPTFLKWGWGNQPD